MTEQEEILIKRDYSAVIEKLLNAAYYEISTIHPSDWVEQNVIMGNPFPGPYRYSLTPYCREIIDRFSQDDPMNWIAVKKGAQIGLSSGVLIPILLWMINNDPANTYFMVGAPELIEKATEKLDIAIDNAGMRHEIKSQTMRTRNNKTGDTNTKKEFTGGYISIGSANNHKNIRDVSLKYGLFDDYEAFKSKSKESGSTRKLLEQRFAAYHGRHKIAYISTPELLRGSNIEEAYLMGDQRKYMIPCPCCGAHIDLRWEYDTGEFKAGITWKVNDLNKLISGSVGYICQECGGFFNDKNKQQLLNEGFWKPTAEPAKEGFYSYHISSLYAPIGMYDWAHYVQDWIDAHPVGEPRKEHLYKTFVNVCLGECYEDNTEALTAKSIQANIRSYPIGVVPEKLSLKDGNGKIAILTLSCDLNGKEDDARLDWEVCAWSQNGTSYSVDHGHIGTFIPRENMLKYKQDREPWTYRASGERSVWRELEKLLTKTWSFDNGREMGIAITGVDCSFTYNGLAYEGVDSLPKDKIVVKLKGKDVNIYSKIGKDTPTFHNAKERPGMYLTEVNYLKDLLSARMKLTWDEGNDPAQPAGFMNFPMPADGKYLYKNYFEHFEAEHRIEKMDSDGNYVGMRWEKKTSVSQNHFFDVHIYNMVLKDILVSMICKANKITPVMDWGSFADSIVPKD
jgi:terminase, large subunit